MKLNLSKKTVCRFASDPKWAGRAAAWMGLSFFLRMVYYFALVNLNDVPGVELAFSVILPLIISVSFILILKLPKLSIPLAAGVLAVLFAFNYFFTEQMDLGGILSGILVLAMGGLILAAVLGYIPERRWLLRAGMAALLFRVLFVDLFGYILPLKQWQVVAWIPRASNLFGVAAVACLCAALKLKKAK